VKAREVEEETWSAVHNARHTATIGSRLERDMSAAAMLISRLLYLLHIILCCVIAK